MSIAYANGKSGRHWQECDGEVALIHAIRGDPMEVKLSPGGLLHWMGLPESCQNLRAELQRAGLPSVMFLQIAVGLLLQQRLTSVKVGIDELIRAVGWKPRSVQERVDMRRQLWRWLLMFEATEIIGARPGQYRDPRTRRVIDLVSRDPLLKIVGRRVGSQGAFDGSEPPLEVSWAAGAWLEAVHGNRQVLTNFGDVLRLAAIPAGKVSGAWARGIGLGLQQRWRERASRDPGTFTRRDLLGLFRADPDFEEVLAGDHPERAKRYWQDAITMLKAAQVVGFYRVAKPARTGRQGWQEGWLGEPLDIRPMQDYAPDIRAIAASAETFRKKRGRPRKNPAPSEAPETPPRRGRPRKG